MLKYIRFFAAVWLVAVLFFGWGLATIQYKVFPFNIVNKYNTSIQEFIAGHPDEPVTTAVEKLESDAGGVPHRYLIKDVDELAIPEGSTTFSIKEMGLNIEGYYNESLPGYFLISGAFNLDGLRNIARILVSSRGKYVRLWNLTDKLVSTGIGVAIDDTRNVIMGGDKMQQHFWCSPENQKPAHLGPSNHTIEIAPDGTYWTHVHDGKLVQYDPDRMDKKGHFERIRTIYMAEDLIELNREISPLIGRAGLRIKGKSSCELEIRDSCIDLYHINDVQPFVDKRFPTALGYALLVSVRNQNLIMVVDPDTKKILWYRYGLVEQQHDVDYFEGSIYVYDNGPFRGYSRLQRIEFDDPNDGTFGATTVIDGRDFLWFDPSRGQHDVFSVQGRRYHLVINDRQGRIYLFNDRSEPVFALQNYLEKDTETNIGIQLRSAIYIPQEQFDNMQKSCNSI